MHEGDPRTQLCRVENFCSRLPTWDALTQGVFKDLVSQIFRQSGVLFKDKLNFKGPGGGGFRFHQDANAYASNKLARRHVTVLLAIDAAGPDTGPIQFATGYHNKGVLTNNNGVISPEIEQIIEFESMEMQPGDIVLFNTMLPHRSASNLSPTDSRRAAFLTFNAASEGDFHEAYYEHKAKKMREGAGFAFSLIDDFAGTVLPEKETVGEGERDT